MPTHSTKTCVVVGKVHGHRFDVDNESLDSKNAGYLLFTLACFLEDYLELQNLGKLYKKHLKDSENY